MSKENIPQQLDRMDRELRFLWQEAHEETVESIKERKLKQYYELFKAYKKQKQFLIALEAK
ncbi:hypothetical protein [Bdellovibrio bacteriovorus]|uniref:Uncharacterized protein n=1 Tax=Bdellovibrio bacteriovorus str. Tiberius TaxID=1069642 RepID=K7ZA90_BDEBC|nr:hypothetical protein [Bdellovibrio bacteriovorus]AFY01544.1 hypothetical protein Bdt_1857 [Bdellovibrio bacteriovorus str. Tiberius]